MTIEKRNLVCINKTSWLEADDWLFSWSVSLFANAVYHYWLSAPKILIQPSDPCDISLSYFDQVICNKWLKIVSTHPWNVCSNPICARLCWLCFLFCFYNPVKKIATAYFIGDRAHSKWPSVPQKNYLFMCTGVLETGLHKKHGLSEMLGG